MNALLANDLVIQEDNCNLSCQYCLTGQSNFKKEHSEQLIFQPPRPSAYSPESALGRRLDQIITTTGENLDLPIIKVTGGEIFLVRGIMNFLRHISTHFATVVIQTNGVLLDQAKTAEIKSWGNACLQISLDAKSFEGNSYRSSSPDLHDKILRKIFDILDVGIPTEIYCVLNDRSLSCLEDTLNAFLPYADHVVVHPFPVRGPDHNGFFPKPEQIAVLHQILEHFDDYASILPPRAYFARLLRFFVEGERTFRCHLPRFAFTTFDDGTLTSCPNIWFNKVGNVLAEEPRSVTDRIFETPFHQLLLAPKPRIEACKGCFTPWDMLSLYVDNEITLDELCRTPMYSAQASRVRIEQITSTYREAQ
jgi:MoaA/NifB/PqqE/SkfB family radical SAM enzyme